MARIAYRLWVIKEEENYIKAGYTKEEAQAIIDFLYEEDEDFTSKAEYIRTAKYYCKECTEYLKLTKPLDWKIAFGMPDDIGYRYCSKCEEFFWDGEPCGCE